MDTQQMLDLDEWAAECRCEPKCILLAVNLGIMPRPVTDGGEDRWDRATLDAWINAGHPRQDAAADTNGPDEG